MQSRLNQDKLSIVELTIDLMESFREIAGWSNNTFLDYMNTNNNWSILNDEMLMRGLIGADIEDYVEIFGRSLSKHEQDNIISRYYSKFQYS